MQIKRIASTNKNYTFLIGYWLRGQDLLKTLRLKCGYEIPALAAFAIHP